MGQGGGGWVGGQRSEACVKIQKKKFGGGGLGRGGGGGLGRGGKCGCEWRSEAFVKIQKKKFFFFGVGGVGLGGGSVWMGTEN